MVWCRSESSMVRPHNHQHLSLTSQVGVARTMLVVLAVGAAHASVSVDRAAQHAPALAAHLDNGETLFVQNCAGEQRHGNIECAVPRACHCGDAAFGARQSRVRGQAPD
jgi:hypothetical protein